MIALTRITSSSQLSKGFRLRGQALEKIQGGRMFSGTADRIEIADLTQLADLIQSLTPFQALTFGTVKVPGDHHKVVMQKQQKDGETISRTRAFFEFAKGQEGILLLDYDPPKSGEPLSATELLDTLDSFVPGLTEAETLITASASSFIYRTKDGEMMKGPSGWHVFVRVADAHDIPMIGAMIDARGWLAGLGRVELSSSGGKLLRGLVDTLVWQPERLSFDAGAACGTGLVQKRPDPLYRAGRALTLADVDLPDADLDRVQVLQDEARGIKPRGPSGGGGSKVRSRIKSVTDGTTTPTNEKPLEKLTPIRAAEVMDALLHIKLEVDYQTHISVGMGLKNSFGDAGFALWDAWSKPSIHYKGEQHMRAKWARMTRQGYTVATVFHLAKERGWTGRRVVPPIDEIAPLPIRALPDSEHERLAATKALTEARSTTLQTLYEQIVRRDDPIALSALRITVGVGKTSSLKKIFDDIKRKGKSITIVAKDKTQCAAYEAAGAFWRHGRETTLEGFTPATPWHCPHAGAEGPVAKLAEQEHRLQAMCRGGHCAHGNRAMLDKALENGKPASDTVIRFFKEKPELASVEPCGFFDHLADGQRQAIRVVTAAGLSPADIATDHGQVDYLIVDEGVEWSHSHMLDLATIRSYIERLTALKESITDRDPDASTAFLDAPVAIFRDLAVKIGHHAANADAGVYTPVSFDLPGIVDALDGALDEHGAAIWEKPQWAHWTELVRAPLRALSAIRDGLKAGSLSMKDGALHLTYLHSVIENAVRGPHPVPVLIMDATLDETAAAMVGDRVTHVVAEPNCDWVIDPRWFMAAKKDASAVEREAERLLRLWQRQEAETGEKSYVICRKALAMHILGIRAGIPAEDLFALPKEALWQISIEYRIGWYGWHDTAHDEWNGMNCIIWGQQPVPDDVRLQHYADHRAAMMQIRPDSAPLPMAENTWQSGQWIRTGDHEQQSMARLPVQQEVRDWLLRKVAAQKIQAAGRSRAVCQDRRVVVWQVGGYPMTGLAEHGIRPTYARLVDGLSAGEVAAMEADRRMQRMTIAAAALVAEGRAVSRRSMREKDEVICMSLNNKGSSRGELVRDPYIYIYQHRTSSEPLDANKNNDLQDGGVWDHEYSQWLESPRAKIFADRMDTRAASIDRDVQSGDSGASVSDMDMAVNAKTPPAPTATPTPAEGTGEGNRRTVSGWIADHLPNVEPTHRLRVEVKRLFQTLKQDGHDAAGAMQIMQKAADHVKIVLLMHSEDGIDPEQIAREELACAWATPHSSAAAHLILAIVGTDAQAVAGAA
jgi:hypothetical protein